MLDFDAGKLLIIGLVALVVIGPKDLPRVLRQVGQAIGKLRRMAGEFQGQFMDAMKEADLQDLKTEIAKLKDSATLDVDFDPARDVKQHLTSALSDPAPAADPAAAGPASLPEPHDVSLPAPFESASETTLAATGIGPVADLGPGPDLGPTSELGPSSEPEPVATTHSDAVEEPAGEPTRLEPAVSIAPIEPVVALKTARRKIVVTNRRRLSRLDGPTLRAATLHGRSRNILPARRDTKDQ